jgi:hypothetical protein
VPCLTLSLTETAAATTTAVIAVAVGHVLDYHKYQGQTGQLGLPVQHTLRTWQMACHKPVRMQVLSVLGDILKARISADSDMPQHEWQRSLSMIVPAVEELLFSTTASFEKFSSLLQGSKLYFKLQEPLLAELVSDMLQQAKHCYLQAQEQPWEDVGEEHAEPVPAEGSAESSENTPGRGNARNRNRQACRARRRFYKALDKQQEQFSKQMDVARAVIRPSDANVQWQHELDTGLRRLVLLHCALYSAKHLAAITQQLRPEPLQTPLTVERMPFVSHVALQFEQYEYVHSSGIEEYGNLATLDERLQQLVTNRTIELYKEDDRVELLIKRFAKQKELDAAAADVAADTAAAAGSSEATGVQSGVGKKAVAAAVAGANTAAGGSGSGTVLRGVDKKADVTTGSNAAAAVAAIAAADTAAGSSGTGAVQKAVVATGYDAAAAIAAAVAAAGAGATQVCTISTCVCTTVLYELA